jgi:hypothetical protein
MQGYISPLKGEESKYAFHFFGTSRPAFQDRSKSAFFLISHMEKHRDVSMKTSGRFCKNIGTFLRKRRNVSVKTSRPFLVKEASHDQESILSQLHGRYVWDTL